MIRKNNRILLKIKHETPNLVDFILYEDFLNEILS